jgi:oligopeptide transport system ATP-binding protein
MYRGRLVELGPAEEVLQDPLHPYTRALIAAVPVPNPAYRRPDFPEFSEPAETYTPLEERRPGHWVANGLP